MSPLKAEFSLAVGRRGSQSLKVHKGFSVLKKEVYVTKKIGPQSYNHRELNFGNSKNIGNELFPRASR